MSDPIQPLCASPAPQSSAVQWAPLARLIERERRIASWAAENGPIALFAYEFVRFGIKQGWACLFGGLMLALLLATHLWYPKDAALARYDFLVLGAVAIQGGMLAFRLETLDEAKVILAFHVIGTAMEVFKTSAGSWAYPEPSVLRIEGVPLFSGFMYAAAGSYLARVWRLFDFELRAIRRFGLWASWQPPPTSTSSRIITSPMRGLPCSPPPRSCSAAPGFTTGSGIATARCRYF